MEFLINGQTPIIFDNAEKTEFTDSKGSSLGLDHYTVMLSMISETKLWYPDNLVTTNGGEQGMGEFRTQDFTEIKSEDIVVTNDVTSSHYIDNAKQYLLLQNFGRALEEVETGLRSDPFNRDLLIMRKKIRVAREKWNEVDDLWSLAANQGRSVRRGRMNSKDRYRQALINYYLKSDEFDDTVDEEPEQKQRPLDIPHLPDSFRKFIENVQPGYNDIRQELQNVYDSWCKNLSELDSVKTGRRGEK